MTTSRKRFSYDGGGNINPIPADGWGNIENGIAIKKGMQEQKLLLCIWIDIQMWMRIYKGIRICL